ncbi:MAG: DNA replication and repair protein RecF [Gemmatimonadaceae bacterium]|nr:DNA replication and repair protein RecF [Gemmatimonadaceae bacterium]
MEATEAIGEARVTPAPPPVRVRRLTLRNVRNIEHAELDVPPAGVVLVGRNGHGKTNLLEAVHYAHALRSMRGARDADLVRFGCDALHIAMQVDGSRVDDVRIGIERGARRKRLVLDGIEVPRLADALGAVPSVVLSPRDVVLVSGAPLERRRFLDIVLAATSPRYLGALQRYRAALLRRNAVLRDAATRADGQALAAVWEPALAEAGARLWTERMEWVRVAAPRVRALCALIGEPATVGLRHQAGTREHAIAGLDEEALRAVLADLLAKNRTSDIRRGMTQHGPHRDDVAIVLGGRLARTFGSAGQQRTIALALRMVEAETLRDRLERAPVLLLDDPFAELDRERAQGILGVLSRVGDGQRILAVPRDDDVPPGFTALARWTIEHGEVRDA